MDGKIGILAQALGYVEEHLADSLSPRDVADACHYSLSGMQKIFGHVFSIGMADYIARRRLTRAARDLLSTQDSVLDIALRYGYSSHEVFTRAFRRLWGETPRHFRMHRSFADLYPPQIIRQGGSAMSTRRTFDLTELYDAIRDMDGTWAVILDTTRLMEINDTLGRAAGDLAIAECARRIDQARTPDMLMFRIGGDEFILLTGMENKADAAALAGQILSRNGETVTL